MVGTGKRKERLPRCSTESGAVRSFVQRTEPGPTHWSLARLCPSLRSSASGSLCHTQSLGLLALPATKGRRHRPFLKIPSSSFSINGPFWAKYGGGRECRGEKSRCLKRISSQEIRRIKRTCCRSPYSFSKQSLSGQRAFTSVPFLSTPAHPWVATCSGLGPSQVHAESRPESLLCAGSSTPALRGACLATHLPHPTLCRVPSSTAQPRSSGTSPSCLVLARRERGLGLSCFGENSSEKRELTMDLPPEAKRSKDTYLDVCTFSKERFSGVQ